MCGIAGLVLLSPRDGARLPDDAAAHVRAMLDSMAYRGPDGQGIHCNGPVCLGHRRLSIIDLAGGAQPMDNGRHVLTFNGEIYNYRELRALLEEEGFRFRTASDTEVLLAAYAAPVTASARNLFSTRKPATFSSSPQNCTPWPASPRCA